MNGYTYLRTHRILVLLSYLTIFYTAYSLSVPKESEIEE